MESVERDRVDFVLPVYNEVRVLRASVERLAEALAGCQERPWRIVVADNGSTDGTTELASQLAEDYLFLEVLHLDAKGRGRALRKAWSETDAEFSIYMDVDLSTDLEAVPAMVRALEEGADLVTGSRLHREARTTRSAKREILSRGYNQLLRRALRTRTFDDAQCGFKGVRVRAVRPLLPLVKNEDWFFDTELLVLAEYAGLTVRSLPVRWIEDADSRVRILKTVWQEFQGLARMWWSGRRVVRGWQREMGGVEAGVERGAWVQGREATAVAVRSPGFSRNPDEDPPKGGTTNGAFVAAGGKSQACRV